MEDIKTISGTTEQEIWQTVEADLRADEDILSYEAVLLQDGRGINLYIDIDPGGGFEGGYELTQLSAKVKVDSAFRFAIHDEGFVDEIGKFFGMQDLETGFADLDHHIVIKTNHEDTVRTIFADADVRAVFTELENFDFGIHAGDEDADGPVLELNIDEGITDADRLRKIYHAFYHVLKGIETLP
ncbi:hypothetical protein MUY27_12080 [Mucilaginibacter sp. RS28]|uniref:Uncharacterized protein n=1 Tax=Mucilaginibacter straminoryzae TaxID=2932774 RepID=A0A9X1X3U2_9SPHI|nr:hypothetical protein [Mucilaginibacter straminoryzae]MCJ8210446.1 hypothetical protein [Mucilaginibacter straminoryzae]